MAILNAAPPPVAQPIPCALSWTYPPELIPIQNKILSVVATLSSMGMTPMDLVIELLRPTYQANADGFYRSKAIENFLNVVSSNSKGSKRLDAWFDTRSFTNLIKDICREADDLSIAFRASTKDLTPEGILNFDFTEDVTAVCEEVAPKMRRILMAVAQTPRAARENTVKDPEPIVTMIQAQLMKTRSQNNNLCAIPCSLYFYASGMPRKVVDTLAHAGLNLSYNAVKDTHSMLAKGQMRRAQIAARGAHSASWDNAAVTLSIHVEQRTGGPPKVQTGTTTLIYDLRAVPDRDALQLAPILDRRAGAERITYAADIRPTRTQCAQIRTHLCISLVELLTHGNSAFDYLKDDPLLRHPQYRPPPKDHVTNEYPLRTTEKDEGSSDGTVQVNDDIYLDQLQFGDHDLDNIAVPSYNDQKTNALIRSAQLLRTGDLSVILRLQQYQLGLGWFHVELNLSWLLLRIHRGNGADLGSLQYFIGLLAKVRLGSAQPDFETLVSLLMQVLRGASHHYWEVESNMTIKDLAKSKPTAAQLLEISSRIFTKYASGASMEPPSSDNTTRNLHLLVRDTLLFYFLRTSISSGDFGRVELLLGTLTMMFAGGGSPNYQKELLYFIQNLKKVWTPAFANIMRDNSLITTSGRGYVGVDKNAEFNINFQKNFFASKGVHASWDLLADLSPNVPILRRLKTQFGEFLGAPWQGITHTKVDTSTEVKKIKGKMREYRLEVSGVAGRRETEREAEDIIRTGGAKLKKTGMKTWEKGYTSFVNSTS
ncbi:hypothetical protein C8J57DRAFT_1174450 [Mycena rebaudengoi]|nr:hypothetical protein C8J57DRAFT_1174450 [Mycena rebaudengoi]